MKERQNFTIYDDVFTNGAYLSPINIDGKWRWVATGFEDDTFWVGDMIDPQVSSDTVEGLIKFIDDDDVDNDVDGEKE